jgi:rhodanese-related sulfurtransferase
MHIPFYRNNRGVWPWDWPSVNPMHTDKVESWEITPLELRSRLDAGEPIVLVDVRELWEANIVSLPNSRFIPLNELRYRAEEDLEVDDVIVLYCHHGVRSMEGVMILWDLGYENVMSLAGGIGRWTAQVDPELPTY